MRDYLYEDLTCLAEGCIYPADSRVTGINANELIVGSTGCGKTVSVGESRLLHTHNSSLVVPIAKKALKKRYKDLMESRGYNVVDLDFSNPQDSSVGYDPLDYVETEDDIANLARNIITNNNSVSSKDQFWDDSGTELLTGLILLARLLGEDKGEKVSFSTVLDLFDAMNLTSTENDRMATTNLTILLDILNKKYPNNRASSYLHTISDLSRVTSSSVRATVASAIKSSFNKNVIELLDKPQKLALNEIGERKTVVFITTSPYDLEMTKYINIFYSDLMRVLFKQAEANPEGRLKVPVHIIFDDFACGGRIRGFEDYISIFRAAGISASLFLQSESQLMSMYGNEAACTIINNCDSYVYMGGLDYATCKKVSEMCNKPARSISSMKLGDVIVFRRGEECVYSQRYKTYEDEEYMRLHSEDSRIEEVDYGGLR